MHATSNPPWADKIWDKYAPVIHDFLRAHNISLEYMPGDTRVELGCGSYGCVYETRSPGVVCKLTTDQTEAIFVSNLSKLPSHAGIVQYYNIFSLPSTFRNRQVYVIWRERAEAVGHRKVCDKYIGSIDNQNYKYARSVLNEYEQYNQGFMFYAARARMYIKNKDREFSEAAGDAAGDAGRVLLWEFITRGYELADQMEGDLELIIKPKTPGYSRALEQFAFCLCQSRVAAEMMESNAFGYQVGAAIKHYYDEGYLLADVHMNNLGIVKRDDQDTADSAPVIIDPGHAVPLRPELATAEIEQIPYGN